MSDDRKLPTREELTDWRTKYARYLDSRFSRMIGKLLFAAEERERLQAEVEAMRSNAIGWQDKCCELRTQLAESEAERPKTWTAVAQENDDLRSRLAKIEELSRAGDRNRDQLGSDYGYTALLDFILRPDGGET